VAGQLRERRGKTSHLLASITREFPRTNPKTGGLDPNLPGSATTNRHQQVCSSQSKNLRGVPDWSYSTLLQPVFRRLPHDSGRRFVNGFLGTMGGLPLGPKVIDLMGHMAPSQDLETGFLGLSLSSPVVLAPSVDPTGRASRAFGRFGFGGLVIGPLALQKPEPPTFEQTSTGTLTSTGGPVLGWSDLPPRTSDDVKIFAEIMLDLKDPDLPERLQAALATLRGKVDSLVLSPQAFQVQSEPDAEALKLARDAVQGQGLALLLGMPESVSPEVCQSWARPCSELGIGLYIGGHPLPDGRWEWGGAHARTVALVQSLRADLPLLPIAADSGVLAPTEALELVRAGANLVIVSAGLVQTGPGLAKRINDALLFGDSHHGGSNATEQAQTSSAETKPEVLSRGPSERRRPETMAWFWAFLLGISLLVGAGLAGWVALTQVVLPYDEEFCGKTAAEIAAFNPKVLSFMTHDRITLSGTMVSLGILYIALGWFEIRQGSHWAQRAVQVSAASGFVSFFAFLGYGYFDPFHAMVAAMLSQITIQAMVLPAGPGKRRRPSESFSNDRAWRRGMWGQLLFVVHGAALILAGSVILTYGVTEVFVPQDIDYLGMDAQRLALFDPQLKALIAHDRATFGGMLVSAGIALLLTTLWGFRRGESWLWWVYLVVISEPYLQTLWIHWEIGYRNHFHLAPVYIGIVLLVAGLAASHEYLTGQHA
jgi:hypothetical protein